MVERRCCPNEEVFSLKRRHKYTVAYVQVCCEVSEILHLCFYLLITGIFVLEVPIVSNEEEKPDDEADN